MSIDPASIQSDVPTGIHQLDDMIIHKNAVYVFDFDGVVSSSLEDDIYHLPSWDGEDDLLARAAAYFEIRCGSMERKYQRHLLYQAASHVLNIDIEPGPALPHVIEADKTARLFILTARSGWFAVERLRNFFKDKLIAPIEVFNVGRTTKDRQIDLLCREFSSDPVFYIEDNASHLTTAHRLNHPNLELVFVDRITPKNNERTQRMFVETIKKSMPFGERFNSWG